MKTYLRILGFISPYRSKFFAGVIFSFFFSVFNGITLTALKPVFDAIETGGNQPFQLKMSGEEKNLLLGNDESRKSLNLILSHPFYEDSSKLELKGISPKNIIEEGKYQIARGKLAFNAYFVNKSAFDVLLIISLSIIPIYFLKLISGVCAVYFIASAGLSAIRDIRDKLHKKLLFLPISKFAQEKTGVLMSRITNDVNLVENSISHELKITINNFFIIVTHLGILLLINSELLFMVTIIVPLVILPVNYFAHKVKKSSHLEQEAMGSLSSHLQEIISGIRVIRAFSMENYEQKQFSSINNNLRRSALKKRLNHVVGPSLVEFVSSLVIIGLLVYGSFQILNSKMSSGDFFLFLFTVMLVLSPLKQFANWYNTIHLTAAAGERIFEITNLENEIQKEKSFNLLNDLAVSIEFKSVGFRYPEMKNDVLQHISFEIPIGKTVALVGHSGAGKSTLVDLIPRFYDVSEGQILFDGNDIRKINIDSLRKKIGIVTQDIFLFNGTIKDNIMYGQKDIALDLMLEASKSAHAHEFIKDLPKGYETQIGERGQMLSGGQRQRISIARALLKNPRVLILDEATSALDTHSEKLVQSALENLMKNRTTFVIAHRLSTIYKADLILVLDRGKIVERGTHSNLLKMGGKYQELYQMQFQS